MKSAMLLALAACNPIVGAHDYTSPDASGSSDIQITAIDTYHLSTGIHTEPQDLTNAQLSAYTIDPDTSAITRYAGTGAADGIFTISGVPAGDYYVQYDHPGLSTTIFRLHGRTLDLGVDLVGDPTRAKSSDPQPVQVSAHGLSPFLEYDQVTMYAPIDGGDLYVGGAPMGARDFDGEIDRAGRVPLAGDEVVFAHQADVAGRGPTYRTDTQYTREALRRAAVTQPPSGALTIDVSPPSTAPRTTLLHVDIPALRARWASGGSDDVYAYIVAAPDDNTATYSGPIALAYRAYSFDAGGAPTVFPITYGDPYPAQWSRSIFVDYERSRRDITIPGAPFSVGLYDFVESDLTVIPSLNGAVVLPSLGASSPALAQHITLDGESVIDRVRRPSDAPYTVAWDPVPGATHYLLQVYDYTTDGTTVRSRYAASVETAEPLAVLPGATLPEGARISFRVLAYVGGSVEPHPYEYPTSYTVSGTQTDLVFMSSTCGDGVVDAGEQCDTSGPSSTCDFDCSLVVCGDGVPNPAAGEQCDASDDRSEACEVGCKLPRCGDGIVNGDEQCDGGAGCTSACTLRAGACGNGVREAGEECDDGNAIDLDGCSNACKRGYCGDGVRQTGEQCDDGNLAIGDGCTDACAPDQCGDGYIVLPEQCELGDPGCNATCRIE